MAGTIQGAAAANCRSAEIEAVIIRADGSRVNLGTVAYYHRNPVMMAIWRVRQWLKGVFK